MPIVTKCCYCAKKLKIPTRFLNESIRCPNCKQLIIVDDPESETATNVIQTPEQSIDSWSPELDQATENRTSRVTVAPPSHAGRGAGLGVLQFSLKKTNLSSSAIDFIGGWPLFILYTIGYWILFNFLGASIFSFIYLRFGFVVMLVLTVPIVIALHFLYLKNLGQRLRSAFFEIHQNGIFCYHPIGLFNFIRPPQSMKFTDIQIVASQDQVGYMSVYLPVMRVLSPRRASHGESQSSGNLVIKRKGGTQLVIFFVLDIYTQGSLQNLINHLKNRHPHIKINVSV